MEFVKRLSQSTLQPRLIILLSVLTVSTGIPIDNQLTGDAEVQCGEQSMLISVSTDNRFLGRMFAVEGKGIEGCSTVGEGRRGAFLRLHLNDCKLRIRRTTEPLGLFVEATVIIQFHPFFMTKIDRAFHFSCFFMESSKEVNNELEVSTQSTLSQELAVPMPDCTYTLHDTSPDGPQINFGIVGQKIYHKWNCRSNHEESFCMEVHSCAAQDGRNIQNTIQITDERGCALDENLLENLEYSTNLMAGQLTHAYKFADRSSLLFNCLIRIGVKDPNATCSEWRQSTDCDNSQSSNGRKRRSIAEYPDAEVKSEIAVHEHLFRDSKETVGFEENADGQLCVVFGYLVAMVLVISSLCIAAAIQIYILKRLTKQKE